MKQGRSCTHNKLIDPRESILISSTPHHTVVGTPSCYSYSKGNTHTDKYTVIPLEVCDVLHIVGFSDNDSDDQKTVEYLSLMRAGANIIL